LVGNLGAAHRFEVAQLLFQFMKALSCHFELFLQYPHSFRRQYNDKAPLCQ
jgi:hypothetical protein